MSNIARILAHNFFFHLPFLFAFDYGAVCECVCVFEIYSAYKLLVVKFFPFWFVAVAVIIVGELNSHKNSTTKWGKEEKKILSANER